MPYTHLGGKSFLPFPQPQSLLLQVLPLVLGHVCDDLHVRAAAVVGGSAQHANQLEVGGAVDLSWPIVVGFTPGQVVGGQLPWSELAQLFHRVVLQRGQLSVAPRACLAQLDVALQAERRGHHAVLADLADVLSLQNLVALLKGHGGQVRGQGVHQGAQVLLCRHLGGWQDGASARGATNGGVVAGLGKEGQHTPAADQVCAGKHLGLGVVLVADWTFEVSVGGCRGAGHDERCFLSCHARTDYILRENERGGLGEG